MGVEVSKETTSDDSLISQVIKYDWQRVYYTYKALVDRKYSALSCPTINSALFGQLLKFPRFITKQLVGLYEDQESCTVYWKHCLSGVLLCTHGEAIHKIHLLLQVHDIKGTSIGKETFRLVLRSSVLSARSIVSGSKFHGNFDSLDQLIHPGLDDQIDAAFTNIAQGDEFDVNTLEQWTNEHTQFIQSLIVTPPTTANQSVQNVSPQSMTHQSLTHRDVLTTKTTSYRWHQVSSQDEVPKTRTKHAMCVCARCVYMYGGKDTSIAYKDMWKYDLVEDKWSRLTTSGHRPPSLQGHTLLPYKNKLYMYGGDFGFCGEEDVPLWVLYLETSRWRKLEADGDSRTPSSRRNHSAVICGGNMIVYGGYVDLKGSTSELWSFSIDEETWTLLYSGIQTFDGPGARHGHTAVVYKKAMWIYGGMSDLQSRDDLWKWNPALQRWLKIKYRGNPPDLTDHTASVVGETMYVFGGTHAGTAHNDLWALNFESLTWQKLSTQSSSMPPPSIQHCAITVTPFMLQSCDSPTSGERTRSLPYLKPAHDLANQNRPRSSPGYLKSIKNQLITPNKISGENVSTVVCDRPSAITPPTPGVNHKQTPGGHSQKRHINQHSESQFETNFMNVETSDKSAIQNRLVVTYEPLKDSNNVNSQSGLVKQQSHQSDKRYETKLRRSVLNRQTSSCESINAGQGGRDFVPLLKKRSSTIGDLSLDSNSGFDNPSFLNSSQGSAGFHEVTKGECVELVPLKKQRSEVSGSRSCYRSSSADSIIDSKQNRASDMKKQVSFSTEMLDSVDSDSFGRFMGNVGAESRRHWAEEFSTLSPRSRSKCRSGSSSCEDLILEDIEDCDMQTLIDQSDIFLQEGKSNVSFHSGERHYGTSDRSNLISKSGLRNNDVEMQVFVNKSAVLNDSNMSHKPRNTKHTERTTVKIQNSDTNQSGSVLHKTNQSKKKKVPTATLR